MDDIAELAAETGDNAIQAAYESTMKDEKCKNIFKGDFSSFSRLFTKIFSGCKVYISRECPRKPLAFVIRSLGGEVSWDKHLFPGATFGLDDDDVTHLIIDRPQAPHKLGRVAVQPQWAFDSCNYKGNRLHFVLITTILQACFQRTIMFPVPSYLLTCRHL